MEIIRLLQKERKERKLSKYAVAQRSGVSESMVGLVERGLRNPSIELIIRLSDGIGADFSEIVKRAIAAAKREQHRKSGK